MDLYQLIIRNGRVFDSLSGTYTQSDVIVDNRRVLSIGRAELANARGATEIDAEGSIVAPGLVDMHTHVFAGQDSSVSAAELGPPSGTTTFVDAGSTGAGLWGAFASQIERTVQRIVPFINIATIGITSIRLRGELSTPAYTDLDACVEAVRELPIAAGVKVRASHDVGQGHAETALAAARTAADRLELPLMVHLGPSPASVEDILSVLGPGDILTHCFTSFSAENGLLADGVVRPAAIAARRRGVIFDIGYGGAGFDFATASRAIGLGFAPDTISSDLHAGSRSHVVDLPTVLTRLLATGLSVEEALIRATSTPARVIGRLEDGIGHLRPGGVADIVVLDVSDSPTKSIDRNGTTFVSPKRITVTHTIQDGVVAYDPRGARSPR